MHIELEIFSGRPNPCWDLTPQKASEFYVLLRNLPESAVTITGESELGYRGFIVTGIRNIEGCSEIVVFRERVVIDCYEKKTQLIDDDRALELWLLQTGKKHLDDSVYQLVRTEIDHN